MAETVGALILTAVASSTVAAGSFTIAGVTTTYATIVGTAALTAASIGLSLAFASSGNIPKPENGQQDIQQSIPPALYGFGRNRVAGAIALSAMTLTGDAIEVRGIHDGRICGFTGVYWLHDDEITIDGSGIVQEGEDGRYGDVDGTFSISIATRDGLDTETAYNVAVAAIDDPAVWTDEHRGDFTASTMIFARSVEADKHQVIYPHGLPKPSAEIDTQGCYDPRLEGLMTLADRASWETAISYNPIVQMIRFITQARGGMGLDYDLFILPNESEWIEAAQNCDEAITLSAGGTEPRYKCSFMYTSESENLGVIQQFLDSCDGWLGEAPDGSLIPFVGKYKAAYADLTMTDEIIRDVAINYGVGDDEDVNELQVSFTWPESGYKEQDVDPWKDDEAIANFGRKSQPFKILSVQSFTQVRRLAKRRFAALNSPMRGRITTTLAGVNFYKRRWVKVQSDLHPDLADIVIEIRKREIDLMNASVHFDWIVIDPDTVDEWDETTEEGTAPILPDKEAQQSIPVPQNLAGTIGGEEDAIFVQVSFDDPELPSAGYSLRFRSAEGDETSWTVRNFGPNDAIVDAGRVYLSVIPGIDGLIEVQVAIRLGRSTGDWSDSLFLANVLPSLDFSLPQNSGQLIRLLY